MTCWLTYRWEILGQDRLPCHMEERALEAAQNTEDNKGLQTGCQGYGYCEKQQQHYAGVEGYQSAKELRVGISELFFFRVAQWLTFEMGPQRKFESPMVKRTPALEALITSAVVPYSLAIWSAAENSDVLLKQAASVTKLIVKTTKHFCIDELSYPGDFSSSNSVVEVAGVDLGVRWLSSASGDITERSMMLVNTCNELSMLHPVFLGLALL